jgi:hypothetical protein
METLVDNKIKLEEFKFLIDFLDLSNIQEELQSINESTIHNSITLEKYDFHLSFDVETVLTINDDEIEILDVSISNVELWNDEEQLQLTDMMILELQGDVTNRIKKICIK